MFKGIPSKLSKLSRPPCTCGALQYIAMHCSAVLYCIAVLAAQCSWTGSPVCFYLRFWHAFQVAQRMPKGCKNHKKNTKKITKKTQKKSQKKHQKKHKKSGRSQMKIKISLRETTENKRTLTKN